ncbi:MAG: copper amine oxidase N-terminal domain-containing protein, partial [Oscillospiraceae bacterium]|nr:copper amine oxidase N-terminal domain-containing protein [Oscillospiraceae bacterium]
MPSHEGAEEPVSLVVIIQEGNLRALVDENVITASDPTIMQGDTMFVPIESITALMDADISFNGTTFIAELGNQTVVLEVGSWVMRTWIDGQEQPYLEGDLTELPLHFTYDVIYAPLEILMTALGTYVNLVSLVGYTFAVITTDEISDQDALELATEAQHRLYNGDDLGVVTPDGEDVEPEIEAEEDAATEAEPEAEAESDRPTPRIGVMSLVVQEGNVRAVVDGTTVHITNPTTGVGTSLLVPVGSLSELMGANASFSNPTLTVTSGNRRVQMVVGSPTMSVWVNNVSQPSVTLSEPVQFIGG